VSRDEFCKKLATAIRRSNGSAFLEISVPNKIRGKLDHKFFLPLDGLDLEAQKLVNVTLRDPRGRSCGEISARHLNRLGNANHAEEGKTMLFGYPDAFPPAEETSEETSNVS